MWANPILLREIATRAYGRRPYLVKIAYFLVLALVCYYAFSPGHRRGLGRRPGPGAGRHHQPAAGQPPRR